MDYSEIIPDRLWIGRSPSKADLSDLRAKLGPELIIMDLTVNPEEKECCRELGIEYEDRIPEIQESNDPVPLSRLKIVSRIIGDNVDAGRKVVLHCSMGKGRSPTCAAAYLIHTGMSVTDAKNAVASKRPVWLGADSRYATVLDDLGKIMDMTR